jgi:hypothetical protein
LDFKFFLFGFVDFEYYGSKIQTKTDFILLFGFHICRSFEHVFNLNYLEAAPNLPFRIDPHNGTIYTTHRLSKYLRHNYEFYAATTTITTTTGAGATTTTVASASVKVKVRILDLNDNVPEFAKKEFDVSVNEEAAVGLPLLTLTVVNRDETSLLDYSIETDDDDVDVTGVFALVKQQQHQQQQQQQPSSGNGAGGSRVFLTLDSRVGLNYKKRAAYSLSVRVIDQDGLYSYAHIRLRVVPNFDFGPRFTRDVFTFEVAENAKVGTLVGHVDAMTSVAAMSGMKMDSNQEVVYKLFLANTDAAAALIATNGDFLRSDNDDQYAKNSDFRLDEQTGLTLFYSGGNLAVF